MPKLYVVELPDDGALTAAQFAALLPAGAKVTGADSEGDESFIVVQEGGSSLELYVHAHECQQAAEQDQIDCTNDGSYRTTDILPVPPLLRALGEAFYGFLDTFILLPNSLAYHEGESSGDEDGKDEDEAVASGAPA